MFGAFENLALLVVLLLKVGALVPAPALKVATANSLPPDPGKSGAFKGKSWTPDPGAVEATCTGVKPLTAF